MKMNCWQFKKCGREAGGLKSFEMGVCSASTDSSYNGSNGGSNAGRHCWRIAGTLCGGKVQGTYASKLTNCVACDFYKTVVKEEGSNIKR